MVAIGQLSEKVGAFQDTRAPPSQPGTVTGPGAEGQMIFGGSRSSTVMVKLQVSSCPLPSSTAQLTVVIPLGKESIIPEPEMAPEKTQIGLSTGVQSSVASMTGW